MLKLSFLGLPVFMLVCIPSIAWAGEGWECAVGWAAILAVGMLLLKSRACRCIAIFSGILAGLFHMLASIIHSRFMEDFGFTLLGYTCTLIVVVACQRR